MADKNDSDFRFANAVDEDGELVDFRDGPAYEDESEEGKVRSQSQTAESSVVAHKTEGVATNGSPAAKVGKSSVETSTKKGKASDADAAGGREANKG